MNAWTLLADLVVVLHLVWVLYVVLGFVAILLGAALRWRWTRRAGFRWSHALMTLVVALEGFMGWICPLTTWEQELRRAGGGTVDDASFVGRLARDLLFVEVPQATLDKLYVVFGAVVVLVFVLLPPGRPWRRGRGGAEARADDGPPR